MARGISLHIGLNHVDLSQYPDYYIPVLSGCINDANSMRDIARSAGCDTATVLTDAQATALSVKNKITEAARQLVAGDFFFLTYSGHGSQIPDEQDDEDDGYDETWVLYDRQFIDDELYALWNSFKENVRIFVLSDSCHSGSVVKQIIRNFVLGTPGRKAMRNFGAADINLLLEKINSATTKAIAVGETAEQSSRIRTIPVGASLNNYLLKKELYQNIQQVTRGSKNTSATKIKASLLYISGCQDNQLSGDDRVNGVFTGNLLTVWNNGNFNGNYRVFYNNILALMPSDQTPNYMNLGVNIPTFEAQKPFTVLSGTGGGGTNPVSPERPTITGPVTWNSDSMPPVFNIDRGSNPYYYVEVATDNALFNNRENGSRRNRDNFYATWNDAAIGYRLYSEPQYHLPPSVWNKLKNSETLYYRAGTTIDNRWTGWMVTIDDEHSADAPYISIMQETDGQDSDSGQSCDEGVKAGTQADDTTRKIREGDEVVAGF